MINFTHLIYGYHKKMILQRKQTHQIVRCKTSITPNLLNTGSKMREGPDTPLENLSEAQWLSW